MSAFGLILGTQPSILWGGPGQGFSRSDMVTAGAMASLRLDIDDSLLGGDDDDPKIGLLQLDEGEHSSAFEEARSAAWAARPLNPHLLRYDRAVRESMLTDEIGSRLMFTATARPEAALLSFDGSTLVELLVPSTSTITTQAEIVRKRASHRNEKLEKGGRPVLNLHQLVAQHLDPLQAFAHALGISPETHPRTIELVSGACAVLGLKLFPMKHYLRVERPHRIEPQIVPMLDMPGHRSYPGGHSAKSFLAAMILCALASPTSAKPADLWVVLSRIATAVGINRIKAGLHYPMDHRAGRAVGIALALWLMSAVRPSIEVVGVKFKSSLDMHGDPEYTQTPLGVVPVPSLPLWEEMFLAAAEEWQ